MLQELTHTFSRVVCTLAIFLSLCLLSFTRYNTFLLCSVAGQLLLSFARQFSSANRQLTLPPTPSLFLRNILAVVIFFGDNIILVFVFKLNLQLPCCLVYVYVHPVLLKPELQNSSEFQRKKELSITTNKLK